MQNQIKQNVFLDNAKKWIVSLILLPPILYFALNEGHFNVLDYVNLLIHEGGHGIFSFFGKFIYTLGGTIAQIVIPGMFVVFYWRTHKKAYVQVFLVWLGENLINISVYAADARTHQLPLLGGNKVYHDWTYLLNETGLILYDYEVGRIFYWTGIVVFVIALFVPVIIKVYNIAKLDLEL